jgi:hypothetical protein
MPAPPPSPLHCDCAWTTRARCRIGRNDNTPCWTACCIGSQLNKSSFVVDAQLQRIGDVASTSESRGVELLKQASSSVVVAGCSCDWTSAQRCARARNDSTRCWTACCQALQRRVIISMGLSKTGTTATAFALDRVGFRVSHNSGDQLGGTCQAILNTLEAEYDALDVAHPGASWIITHSANVSAWVQSLQSFLAYLHAHGKPEIHWVGGRSFLRCRSFGCEKGVRVPTDNAKMYVRLDPSSGQVVDEDVTRLRDAYELYYQRLFAYFRGRDYAHVDVRAGIYRRVHELIHPRLKTPFPPVNTHDHPKVLQFACPIVRPVPSVR